MSVENILGTVRNLRNSCSLDEHELLKITKPQINFVNVIDYDRPFFFERLSRKCFEISLGSNLHTALFKFYKNDHDDYISVMTLLSYYFANPDELVEISLTYTNEIIHLTGTLDRTVPIINVEQLGHGDTLTYLLISLTDVTSISTPIIVKEPKLGFFTRFRNWFKRLFEKPRVPVDELDLDQRKLNETSYVACFSKKELENNIFDAENAHKILKDLDA